MALPAGIEVAVGREGNPYNFYVDEVNTNLQHFEYFKDNEDGDSVYVLRNGPPPEDNIKFRDRRRVPRRPVAVAAPIVGQNIGERTRRQIEMMDPAAAAAAPAAAAAAPAAAAAAPAAAAAAPAAAAAAPAANSLRMPVGPIYLSLEPVPARAAVPVQAAPIPARAAARAAVPVQAAPVPARAAVPAPVPARAAVPVQAAAPAAPAAPAPGVVADEQMNRIRALEAPYAGHAAVNYRHFQIDNTQGYRNFLASIGAGGAAGGSRRKTRRRARK